MIDLDSPAWAELRQAYGPASDVPAMIRSLRTTDAKAREAAEERLWSSLVHQGTVYTATYAGMPHLMELAEELGPSRDGDMLLYMMACATRGEASGPEVPEFLEESWQDAQEAAREMILARLIAGASDMASRLIASLMWVSAEPSWAEFLGDGWRGSLLATECAECASVEKICWHRGSMRRDGSDFPTRVLVVPSPVRGLPPTPDLEFEDEIIEAQILGLAAAARSGVEHQVRCLLGSFRCRACGEHVPVPSART